MCKENKYVCYVNSTANSLINNRLERLKREKELLYSTQGRALPSAPNPSNLYSFKYEIFWTNFY